MRAIWSSFRKARNCYPAAPQLPADQHYPPVQRSGPTTLQSLWHFPISCSWRMGEENFSSHPLDSFRSMYCCTLHAVQQKWKNTTGVWKGAKCSFTFARTNGEKMGWSCKTCDPVLSNAPANKRHPSTHQGTFLLFAQSGMLRKQKKYGSHQDCWRWFGNIRNRLEAGRLQGTSFKSQQNPLSSLSPDR